MQICVLTRWQTAGDGGPRRPALAGRPEVRAWETLAAAGDLVLARLGLEDAPPLDDLDRSLDCGLVWAEVEPWTPAGRLEAAQSRALRAFLRAGGVNSAQAARLVRPGRTRDETQRELAAWLRARSRRLPPRGADTPRLA